MSSLNRKIKESSIEKRPINVVLQTQTAVMGDLLRYVLQSAEGIALISQKSMDSHRLPNGEGVLISEYNAQATTTRFQSKKGQGSDWPRLLIGDVLPIEEEVSLFQCGEAGYLSLPNQLPFLVKSIAEVANGGVWFSRNVLVGLQKSLGKNNRGEQSNCASELIKMLLTRREYMVKQSVCLGLRNKEVAERLSISEKTVKLHLNRIFKKLSITSRGELMALNQDPRGLSNLFL